MGSAAGFLGLAVLVRFGLPDSFDSFMREKARPDDVWGPVQVRADYIVEGLRPGVMVGLLAALTTLVCVVRRSTRPLVFVGGVALIALAFTLLSKVIVGRLDTHGTTDGHGGSFPSGHTISVVVLLGLAVFIAWPKPRPWIWLVPGLAGLLMGLALWVQTAHWATDVVGGALLAIAILTTVSAAGWSDWSHRSRVGAPPTVQRSGHQMAAKGPNGR